MNFDAVILIDARISGAMNAVIIIDTVMTINAKLACLLGAETKNIRCNDIPTANNSPFHLV
jgi:hypothetical protein